MALIPRRAALAATVDGDILMFPVNVTVEELAAVGSRAALIARVSAGSARSIP